MKKRKKYLIDARKLKALAQTLPTRGIIFGDKGYFCRACDALGDQPLLLVHAEGCALLAHWKAIIALQTTLDGRGR